MEQVIDTIEGGLDSVGLMTAGPYTILYRMILGGLLFGFIMTTIKPRCSFTEVGEARPWSVLCPSEEATSFPWWLSVIAGAIFLGVFI
jgi:hypothetical protein